MTQDPAKARVRFLFHVCNDVAAVRRFYVELLGMEQASFMDKPEFGWLSVDAGGFEMMWFRAETPLAVPTEFASQPGWPGGTRDVTSWAVQIPEDRFADVHRALVAEGARMFAPLPEWRQGSYWGLSVLDPAGATVEVYATPKEKPASTTWPA